MSSIKKRFISKKRKWLALFGGLILLAGISAAFHASLAPKENKADYNQSSPTQDETRAGDDQKETIVKDDEAQKNQNNSSINDDAPVTANISIIDASYYPSDKIFEVRAFISNVYEDGGKCTVTLTKGNQHIARSSEGLKDASTTQCRTIQIARSDFPSSGSWTYMISYKSGAAEGGTPSQQVTIN